MLAELSCLSQATIHKITGTLNVSPVIQVGKVALVIIIMFVTTQTLGNIKFNLQFLRG
jgi:hypothetical protein